MNNDKQAAAGTPIPEDLPEMPPASEVWQRAVADLEQARGEAAANLDGWQRARAEFTNYKRRIEREMSESRERASTDVLTGLLPVIDDMDRAFGSIPEDLQGNPWVSGVTMIQRKFDRLLEQYGVTRIDPKGEPFDPARHEAIGEDDGGEIPSGHVTATMQRGYVVGERVLRPAIVRVAR